MGEGKEGKVRGKGQVGRGGRNQRERWTARGESGGVKKGEGEGRERKRKRDRDRDRENESESESESERHQARGQGKVAYLRKRDPLVGQVADVNHIIPLLALGVPVQAVASTGAEEGGRRRREERETGGRLGW